MLSVHSFQECFIESWTGLNRFAHGRASRGRTRNILVIRSRPLACSQGTHKTMSTFTAELIGTMILIILGDGVVANVLLNKSKGFNAGWIVITTGWALAVTIGVYMVGSISGAHLNPAVTLAMAAIGKFEMAKVPAYLAAQVIGGFLGGV